MPLVTPYNPSWPEDYRRVRDYYLSGVTAFISIEHFGSTSIPGMVGKPIIDIMMVVPFGKMPRAIEELAALECVHKGNGGIPGREVYDYLPPHIDLPVHHFYTCYPDFYQLEGHRAFRDFLIENEVWRKKLSALKLALDEAHDSDRQKYMAGKQAMVEEIIALAKSQGYGLP